MALTLIVCSYEDDWRRTNSCKTAATARLQVLRYFQGFFKIYLGHHLVVAAVVAVVVVVPMVGSVVGFVVGSVVGSVVLFV